MKKVIFSIILTSFGLTVFGQYPTNGLVGYWPFKNNLSDQSENQNPSIVSNLVFGVDRFARNKSCLEFEGDTIPYSILQIPYSQSLTLCFWVKVKQPNTICSVPY